MEESYDNPLNLWCLIDGRAGHRNQVLGLADALARRTSVTVTELPARGVISGLIASTRRRLLKSAADSPPGLILGAGHATHLPLVVLQHRFSAPGVVMMRPTLPLRLFDVCLLPEVHGVPGDDRHIITTQGVLNRVQGQPSELSAGSAGLILIGGPSPHYEWDSQKILHQVRSLVVGTTDSGSGITEWCIATSRRTPSEMTRQLQGLESHCITVSEPDAHDSRWLPWKMASASEIWVSQDSVSMTYEAASSGAATGLLELIPKKINRVTRCIDALVESGRVTLWNQWNSGCRLHRPEYPLREADRCAGLILGNLFPDRVLIGGTESESEFSPRRDRDSVPNMRAA